MIAERRGRRSWRETSPLKPHTYQAFWRLRMAFTVVPIIFGLDKFFHILLAWDIYMAPRLSNIILWDNEPSDVHSGVIEIIAGRVHDLYSSRPICTNSLA